MSDATVLARWFSDEVVAGFSSWRWISGPWLAGISDDDDKFLAYYAGRGKPVGAGTAGGQANLWSSSVYKVPPYLDVPVPASHGSFLLESRAGRPGTFLHTADDCGHGIPLRRNVSSRYSTNTPRAESLHSAVRRVILVDGYDGMEFMTMSACTVSYRW